MNKCTHCHRYIWFWQRALIDSGFNLHVNCVHDFYGWERKPKEDVKALSASFRHAQELMEKRIGNWYE